MNATRIFRNETMRLLAALVASLALAACASQMEPAKKAIADIEAAIAAAGADAQQYIPEQVSSVKAKLADLKAAFDKQDYKTVNAGAPALVTEAQGLTDAAAAKKKEVLEALNTQWTALAAELPQTASAIQAKLATIAKTKKLPAGVTKDGVEAAKSALDDSKTAWEAAKASYGAGQIQAAVDQANGIKAKLADAAAKLGMTA